MPSLPGRTNLKLSIWIAVTATLPSLSSCSGPSFSYVSPLSVSFCCNVVFNVSASHSDLVFGFQVKLECPVQALPRNKGWVCFADHPSF